MFPIKLGSNGVKNWDEDPLHFKFSQFLPLPKFWCINVRLMSSIIEICAFILYIYFKTIVIDISIFFRKWRGSSPQKLGFWAKSDQTRSCVSAEFWKLQKFITWVPEVWFVRRSKRWKDKEMSYLIIIVSGPGCELYCCGIT